MLSYEIGMARSTLLALFSGREYFFLPLYVLKSDISRDHELDQEITDKGIGEKLGIRDGIHISVPSILWHLNKNPRS